MQIIISRKSVWHSLHINLKVFANFFVFKNVRPNFQVFFVGNDTNMPILSFLLTVE